MKTLLTGATGFIGSNVIRELLKEEMEVKAIIRENSDTQNIDEGVKGAVRRFSKNGYIKRELWI